MGRLTEAARTAAKELQPGPKCTIGKLRAALDEEDRNDLDDLLADLAGYTAETIRAALRREMLRLGLTLIDVPAAPTIQRHRTGKCRCESQ